MATLRKTGTPSQGVLVAVAMVVSALVTPGVAGAQTKSIKIGSSNPSSSHYALAIALAESVKAGTKGRVTADVIQSGGSVANIKLLRRGEIAFGIAAGGNQYQAYTGTGPFEGAAYPDLRTFLLYSITPVVMVVRADSGVKTVYDLNGKRFNAGISGSSTERETRSALGALGIKPDYYSASLDDAMSEMKDRRIVGFTKSAASLTSPDGSVLDVSALLDIRVLEVPETDKILKADPTLIITTVPAGVYEKQGQTGPMKVFGHVSGYASSKTVDTEIIYQAYKAIVENKEIQVKAFPGVKEADYLETTVGLANIPLHAGVIKYLREKGVSVPDRLVPPEAR